MKLSLRYLVDVSPELADDINKQVKTGKYKSVQDFILAALQNQVYVETSENIDNDSETSIASGLVNVGSGSTLSPSAKTAESQLLLKPEMVSDSSRWANSRKGQQTLPVRSVAQSFGRTD